MTYRSRSGQSRASGCGYHLVYNPALRQLRHQLAGVGRADAVAALDDTQPIVFHWLAVVAMNATLFAQSR